MTDNTIPSHPSSLNLVSLSRCPSPPAPLTINPYIIKNDFESTESDETNQFKNFLLNEKSNLDFSQQKFRQKFFKNNNNNNNKDLNINSEESLLSSIDFIRFYLDKFDTQINQSFFKNTNKIKY